MTIRAVSPEIDAFAKVAHLCTSFLKDTIIFANHASKSIKITGVELYIKRLFQV